MVDKSRKKNLKNTAKRQNANKFRISLSTVGTVGRALAVSPITSLVLLPIHSMHPDPEFFDPLGKFTSVIHVMFFFSVFYS